MKNRKIINVVFIYGLVISGLAAPSLVHAQTSSPKKTDEQTLRYMKEVEWPKAYREQDTALLDRILAEEFQKIDAEGKWTTKKKAEMEYIRGNRPSYESFRFDIKRLKVFENGTAIVVGTGHINGNDKDGTYKVEYQSSNILIKRAGMWKAISSHVSGVKRTNLPAPKGKNGGSDANSRQDEKNSSFCTALGGVQPGP